MPTNAMQKFKTKYGDMLSCGWLPPTLEIACGAIAASATVEKTLELGLAQKFPGGEPASAGLELATAW